MCLTSSLTFAVGSGAGTASLSLRRLTAELWSTVGRSADGHPLDARDRSTLSQAVTVLRGQASAIDYVNGKRVTSAGVPATAQGLEALPDLIWHAAQQIGRADLADNDPGAGLAAIAERLQRIADGDRDTARDLDGLIERVSRLVEESSYGIDDQVAV